MRTGPTDRDQQARRRGAASWPAPPLASTFAQPPLRDRLDPRHEAHAARSVLAGGLGQPLGRPDQSAARFRGPPGRRSSIILGRPGRRRGALMTRHGYPAHLPRRRPARRRASDRPRPAASRDRQGPPVAPPLPPRGSHPPSRGRRHSPPHTHTTGLGSLKKIAWPVGGSARAPGPAGDTAPPSSPTFRGRVAQAKMPGVALPVSRHEPGQLLHQPEPATRGTTGVCGSLARIAHQGDRLAGHP